jgi:hypothetical protein
MGELYMHTDIGLDRAVCIKQSFKRLHIAFVVCIALSVPVLYGQTEIPEWCRALPRAEYKSLQRVPLDGLTPTSFVTARRMLRASEVRSCHQDCIFATSQVCFLSLTAKANQLALSRRKDICIALTVPVLTVSTGLAKHFSPLAEHGSNAITTRVSCVRSVVI